MKVINIKNAPKDWKSDPNYVYIGRGNQWQKVGRSKWGNPYSLKEYSRDEAIAKYRDHVLANGRLRDALPELEGKILVCHCKPLDCHGDVLVELVKAVK